MSLNLLHGLSLTDGQVSPDRLASAVAGLRADIVGLQEVDRAQPRSQHHDLAAAAAVALGATDFRFEPALVGTPGGPWRAARPGDQARCDQPMYGVALASRFPVDSWHSWRLAAAPVRAPIVLPGTRRIAMTEDEPRVGLAAVIRTPAGRMTIATTHLSFVPGWNGHQLRQLVGCLRSLPAPRVLIGDLNLPGRLPAVVSGWRSLARVATYPATRPRIQLDHALSSGRIHKPVAVQAVSLDLSDHCALVVDLEDRPATVP